MANLYEIHLGTGVLRLNPDPLEDPIHIFASGVLPYFNKAFDEHEYKEFFIAAFPLFEDRFPTATPRWKKAWAMSLILLDTLLHGGAFSLPKFTGNWKDEITIEADRARRRHEWKEIGNGAAPTAHQYVVAFEDVARADEPLCETPA
ncbi:hypothetical protein PLEOSDRAFT_1098511 [Pleurotus ostreatus PC15]|uniref:Uncharacterized protein n=1 Tax=Pleurotus ostreatus (strain PC15) TaxID=1137138 RepID=A0A067P5A5_PLEO1|nr:hypothetical protein PLEOSDRAFT_1102557 [Pleurotus ostreatus PC15]KDQ32511.1 hypothetical protein PLEOSDRAFT_1098511 [Pleurotus ostreatus PC15]